MAVRRGFHRIGVAGLVPCAVIAVAALLWSAYQWGTAPPPQYTVQGPDGTVHTFPEDASYKEIQLALSSRYGRPIQFGYATGEVSYPVNRGRQARNDATTAAVLALVAALFGGAFYLVSWTLGWIIAGFQSK